MGTVVQKNLWSIIFKIKRKSSPYVKAKGVNGASEKGKPQLKKWRT